MPTVEKAKAVYNPTYRINCRNGNYALVRGWFIDIIRIADGFCGSGNWMILG